MGQCQCSLLGLYALLMLSKLLLRYVDDYCFVTTDLAKAIRFLDAMNAGKDIHYSLLTLSSIIHPGHPEYGAFIVPEKTLTNFDYDTDLLSRTSLIEKGVPVSEFFWLISKTLVQVFPWCGLLIDMNGLSVSVDYSRYRGQRAFRLLPLQHA